MAMNLDFLREKITSKFGTIQSFADAIEVNRVSVQNWLSKMHEPEEYRILDIINALELNEPEVDKLMNIPPVSVVFRKIGVSPTESAIKEKSKDFANTFFKIDGSSYVVKGNFFPIKAQADKLSVANHIRSILDIERNEPVVLNVVLSELKKHNINVFFVPFEKIGITFPNQTSHREVAFTAQKGDRKIIFVDTKRTKDEVNFDICHELAHIILDHKEATDEEEKLCNQIAQELVYPAAFLSDQKNELQPFLSAGSSWHAVVSRFNHFFTEYDWSPMGLALALKENELIKKNSYELRRLMKLQQSSAQIQKKLDDMYFHDFDVLDYAKLTTFFSEKIYSDKDIYKPFIELKDAAISGRISSRKLSELLNIDSGDTDELIRSWELEIGAEDSQDDQPTISK